MENYVGEIRLFAGNYAPVGWNLCDGTLLNVGDYQALYALIGNTYGGTQNVNFAVPDLRGRVPVCKGSGLNLPVLALGASGGAEQITITQNNLPPHTHPLMATAAAGTDASALGDVVASATKNVYVTNVNQANGALPPTTPMNSSSISTVGGGQSTVSLMQPSFVLNYIIATNGIYPTQS